MSSVTHTSDENADSTNSTENSKMDGNCDDNQRFKDIVQNDDATHIKEEVENLSNDSTNHFGYDIANTNSLGDTNTVSDDEQRGVIDTLNIKTDAGNAGFTNIDTTSRNDDTVTGAATFTKSTLKNDKSYNKSDDHDNDEGMVSHGPNLTKWQLLKNVLVMSIGFVFVFTSYQAVANLQTSLNKEEGLGAWSIATIYIGVSVSGMFLPHLVISVLGCKWTVTVSMTVYILWVAANFHAVTGLLIPASFLLGVGSACNWPAQNVYLTQLGVWYGQVTGQKKNDAINFFFGLFYLFYQSAQIWGNLISSLVFAPVEGQHSCNSTTCGNIANIVTNVSGSAYHTIATINESILTAYDTPPISIRTCGAAFCPEDALTADSSQYFDQPLYKVYIVTGIYVALGITGAIIMALFLDNIVLNKEDGTKGKRLSPQRLISTFRHLKNSRVQQLLVPITVYDGMGKAFITGEYTKAYVSCSLGIWNLGYSMITFGVVDAVCSLAFGRLVRYTGHVPLFVLAFLTHGGVLLGMLLWRPTPDQFAVFFVIAALWGVGDAVVTSQLCALYGRIFGVKSEGAFANFKLFESVGFIICFSYNNYLCTAAKLYVMIAALVLAFVGYTGAELLCRQERRRKKKESEHLDDELDISDKLAGNSTAS